MEQWWFNKLDHAPLQRQWPPISGIMGGLQAAHMCRYGRALGRREA